MAEPAPLPEAVLAALDDAVLVVGADGAILWTSPQVEQLWGYSSRELTGKKLPLLLSWESRDDGDPAAARGKLLDAFRKDGTSFPVRVVRVDAYSPGRRLLLIRDRSLIARARERLRRLDQALATMGAGVAIVDRDLEVVEHNRALAEMHGWGAQSLVGRPLAELAQEALADIDFRALQSAGGLRAETFDRTRDGDPLPVEIRLDLVLDDDGLAVGAVGIFQDITERKRAEEALRLSEERFALAVRGANDGIWDWNLKKSEIHYSARWQSMLGLEPEQVSQSPDEWFSRVHPEDLAALTEALQRHLGGESEHFEQEHRMLHRDGAYRWMLARGAAIWDATGLPARMAGSQTDITDRKVHDPLTGLPNRALFLDRLEGARARARRREARHFAVLFVDLDRFKAVNDSYGHPTGDQLLVMVARRIETCLRAGDTIARLGGDEFTVLLEEVGNIDEAVAVTDRIHQAMSGPFGVDGHEIFMTASIGIVLGDPDTEDLPSLVRDADTAMYRAKVGGRGRSTIFTGDMRDEAIERLRVETDLRRALERGELEVFYQPIVALKTDRIDGYEALVRWHHPLSGLLTPDHFIPAAEESGLILPLGMWVLEEACRQLAAWRAASPAWQRAWMSVNLSPKLFAQGDLVAQVRDTLARTGLPADRLKLEITEGVLVESPERAAAMLAELRAMGVGICIDDFGTGYSSLAYLDRFAVDVLKIDRSFIASLSAGSDRVDLVRNIIRLATDLGLHVVAEGVETAEQRRRLAHLDCELMQGFHFARPASAEAIWNEFRDRS